MAESQKTEHDVIMELFNDYGSLIPNIELKAGMAKEIVRRFLPDKLKKTPFHKMGYIHFKNIFIQILLICVY